MMTKCKWKYYIVFKMELFTMDLQMEIHKSVTEPNTFMG